MDVIKVVATLSAMVSSELSVEVNVQLECVGLNNKAYAQLSLEETLVGDVPCGGH